MGESVIIGAGAAGIHAALTLRRLHPQQTVRIIDCEEETAYYRTLLPQFINRSLPEHKLFFPDPTSDQQITVMSGIGVESIDRRNRVLHLSDGNVVPYQRLLIASGGRPIVPESCAPHHGDGIFPIRSLRVARAARDWITRNREVVIVGGGLVGVKTAAHLAGGEFSVTLVEKERHLLPQALSEQAAQLVQRHLENRRVRLCLNATIHDISVKNGVLAAVQVDGRWLSAGTLLVAAGSVPETTLLADSGLLNHGRLEVTPTLQTSDRFIFGAGDVVTIIDREPYTPWTWPQAMAQGALAAANMYNASPVNLGCLSRVNSMNLNGFSLAILGAPVAGADVSAYSLPGENIHRELFHRNGKILGGALLGDISLAGRIHAGMNVGASAENLSELLTPQINAFAKHSASCRRPLIRALLAAKEHS